MAWRTSTLATDNTGLHSFFPRLLVKFLEGRTGHCIVENAFLIDYALSSVDITLIAVEPIDAGLKRLLNHELLHDQVTSPPIFAQIA